MRLKITYYGNPVLRKKVSPIEKITDEIRQLAADMIETMHAENGIGLAAPQINISLAIFVSNVPTQGSDGKWIDGVDKVYINPKIIEISPILAESNEGCLSIPKLYATIRRPKWIRIEALDLEGNKVEAKLFDLDAFNFMHENDHLNGVLFIDRLLPSEKKKIESQLRQIKKKYNP